MSSKSKILWTDATWNPVTGCTKISAGCANCYAHTYATRFHAGNFSVTLHPEKLDIPMRWKRQRKIFVNSMSDLFHEDVPYEFIDKVFAVMSLAPRHTFQLLTKRPERMLKYMQGAESRVQEYLSYTDRFPLPNVWLGVTVENQEMADERIPLLLQTPAAKRFVSIEPMLGHIDLTHIECEECGAGNSDGGDARIIEDISHPLHPRNTGDDESSNWCPVCTDAGEPRIHDIDWVIVGGESGPCARPMNPDWARSIRDQCQEAGVPFMFKGFGTKRSGRLLDGVEHMEFPSV